MLFSKNSGCKESLDGSETHNTVGSETQQNTCFVSVGVLIVRGFDNNVFPKRVDAIVRWGYGIIIGAREIPKQVKALWRAVLGQEPGEVAGTLAIP